MIDFFIKAFSQPTPLEWFANVMTVVCIYLAGRNNIHTWWTGIVACAAFGVLFFGAKLYADVTLQVFFLITGIIGWRTWIVQNSTRLIGSVPMQEAKPTGVEPSKMVLYLLIGAVVSICYGAILYSTTDAYSPFADSFVLAFSVLAQILLMRRNIETWPVWVLVNVVSIPLYFSKELYMTSILYGAFLINAVASYFTWKKLQAKG